MPKPTPSVPYLNADGLELIAVMIRARIPFPFEPEGLVEVVVPTLAEAEVLAAEFPDRVSVRLRDLEQALVFYVSETDRWFLYYPGRTLADMGFLTRAESLSLGEVCNA